MVAPIFRQRGIPSTVKIGLAGLLTLILLPILEAQTLENIGTVSSDIFLLSMEIFREILVGILIGFISNAPFWVMSIVASLMSVHMGFQTASLFNPFTEVSTSAIEQFYTILSLALFLSLNGHHLLLRALVHTFTLVPLGTFTITDFTLEQLIDLTGGLFATAIQFSLPVAGTLLLADVGLGLIARAVPQIQVFFLGLPLKIGLGLLTLALSLALILPHMRMMIDQMVTNIFQMITIN